LSSGCLAISLAILLVLLFSGIVRSLVPGIECLEVSVFRNILSLGILIKP
jgi:hypothetical protein